MVQTYSHDDSISGRWVGVNRNLISQEVDENFYTIIQRVTTLENGISETVSIAFITLTGNSLMFTMTDHTTRGPFTIPQATFRGRGAWTPLTPYAVNDTVTNGGALYLVIFGHTSFASFDPGANDGGGHDFYSLMLALPDGVLPTGGAAGMMLTKIDGHDFNVMWKYPVPQGGTAGQILTKVNSTDFNMTWSGTAALGFISAPPSSPGGAAGDLFVTLDGTANSTGYVSAFTYVFAPPPSPAGVAGQVLSTVDGTIVNTTWIDLPSGGGTTFSGLTDVSLTLTANFVPYYNSGATKWESKALTNSAAIQKGDGSGWLTSATVGTDYLAPAAIGVTVEAFDAQLFSNIPQTSKSTAYTTVAADAQKHIFHPGADTTARIYTIDSNANVPYPIGTTITFVNQHSGGVITIAITTDTMRLAGAGTTGSRTLAADGIATALKITATEWIISGTGLT